jgi:hypothetical protein
MYTKEQVDEMLSQVEQEFSNTLETIQKNENVEIEDIETEEVEVEALDKSEEESEEAYEQTIDDLYASMTKGEQEAHYTAVKKSLFDMEKDEDMSPHAKEQQAKEAQKVASAKAVADGSTDKGYDKVAHSDDELKFMRDKRKKMGKSEEDLMTEVEELKKSIETYEGLLDKVFAKKNAPKGKALTGYDVIAKSESIESEKEGIKLESMSKSEITSKLKTIDYSTLTKSDRSAINEYCLENASVEKIKHLIKE